MEALVRRAGLSRLRRCRTACGYGLDRNTRHGRIYCAVLALIPSSLTHFVTHSQYLLPGDVYSPPFASVTTSRYVVFAAAVS